jgi:hypothetical protein
METSGGARLKTKGKLHLVMRSEKRTRIVEFEVPLMTWYGKVGVDRRRAKVCDYVFDQNQMRALGEARELASRSGLALEVTDLSRESALRRVLRVGLRGFSADVMAGMGSRQSLKATPVEAQDVTSPACGT